MDFDKKIKKMSKEFPIPQEYHQRVDEVLETISKDNENESFPQKRYSLKIACTVIAICLFFTGYLFFSNPKEAKADFLGTFVRTIMDFFGVSQDIGVKSDKDDSVAKRDLMIELKEKVIDSQNIYLMVQITAPPDVEFDENIGFDYFGFCRGTNYNSADLVPGSTDLRLLEVLEKKNIASYIVSISTNEQLKEDEEVTVFFKDLMVDPYGDNPQQLVEGMWSVPFTISYTVSEEVTVKGTKEMSYEFLGTTASITELKLTPLGLSVVTDVSNVPYEEIGISDITIAIGIQMIDGSRQAVTSHDEEEKIISGGGECYVYQENEKAYIKYTYQFDNPIDTAQVIGVYVEDCYVSLKEYD